jgi:hypothetical protein
LGEQALMQRRALLRQGTAVAFPHFWQRPAATEKAAWDAVHAAAAPLPFEYWAFPWATLIDGLRGEADATAQVLMALRHAIETESSARPGQRRATVAQHIHALQFLKLFKAAGITDLFWSHATQGQRNADGIRLHAFPLFPAQTPDVQPPADFRRPRRYLANFIGAYNPGLYLTNVREVIFNDANTNGDLLIVKRDAWHFDRAVYDEQIKGLRPDPQKLLAEERATQEYLDAIRESWFTLCPSGSGPNSIRIFESLCLGSIPIVLTQDLQLVGSRAQWEAGAIIEEDSEQGYRRALGRARGSSASDRAAMLEAGRHLAALTAPGNYLSILQGAFAPVGHSLAAGHAMETR